MRIKKNYNKGGEINNVDKKALIESIKEPLREIVMAIIPFLLVYFEKLNTPVATVLYLLIRGLDKYLFEYSKTDKTAKLKGLTF